MDLSLKEKAYTVIRQRIVDGTYAPGSMLNEKEIIAEIGVSRTPFREATAALANAFSGTLRSITVQLLTRL